MSAITDIWSVSGTHIRYPGIRQTGSTCVLVSVAGAINYLARTTLDEAIVVSRWAKAGHPEPTFEHAVSYLKPELDSHRVAPIKYHDRDSPIPSCDVIFAALDRGSVVIPSVQLGTGLLDAPSRQNAFHMLSLFNHHNGRSQVWDSNGRCGFMLDEDVRFLLEGEIAPIPYGQDSNGQEQFLLSHDQHEVIVIQRQ